MGDILKMSQKEITRLDLIQKVISGALSKKDAAKRLDLSYRHTKRLVKAYRTHGAKGLISKQRGKPSNRKFSELFKASVRKIVESDYPDFKPTFAAEKLCERQIVLSKETLRQWMIEWGLWKPKRHKTVKIHQQRERRPCFGELIQIDGSPHDWFEGRNEKCCLIVFTDDATSQIVQMLFVPVENTKAYFECTRRYIKIYGRPTTFYSDRHSIFRVNKGDGSGETQFERAMRELGINVICANSAQAKGRVERANLTLQDRLVKELRLRNISDIETANNYLEEFRKAYNKKFGKPPANNTDMHVQALPDDQTLDLILSERYTRKISKNLEFSYNGKTYQIILDKGQIGYGLRNSRIKICQHVNGEMSVWYKGKRLNYKEFKTSTKAASIANSKEINKTVDKLIKRKINKPSENHPWKRQSFLNMVAKKSAQQVHQALE